MSQTNEVKVSNTNELSRQSIEELGKKVCRTDVDEENGLEVFCHIKCTNEDSDLLKQCKGVIFHGDELVVKTFPYTMEYNHTEMKELEEVLENFSKFSFYDAYEGALLRVFNFGGKWYLSTHRKLNAFNSKWSSPDTFGTQFKNALLEETKRNKEFKNALPEKTENILDQFYTLLDPCKQYMFLVLNGESNRIVCKAAEVPTLYHVGTFVNKELDLDEEFLIPKPAKHKWLNIDELIEYVSSLNYTEKQGVIGFGPNNTQVKIYNKNYQDLFKIRGNEQSIKFRYLQIRMNTEMVRQLYELYPSHTQIFDEYENILHKIASQIYQAYKQRFIYGKFVVLPPREYKVMTECHEWYKQNRAKEAKENNMYDTNKKRVNCERVTKILNKQPATNLNHMIRNYKLEQKKNQEEQSDVKIPRLVRQSPYVATQSPQTQPRQIHL